MVNSSRIVKLSPIEIWKTKLIIYNRYIIMLIKVQRFFSTYFKWFTNTQISARYGIYVCVQYIWYCKTCNRLIQRRSGRPYSPSRYTLVNSVNHRKVKQYDTKELYVTFILLMFASLQFLKLFKAAVFTTFEPQNI